MDEGALGATLIHEHVVNVNAEIATAQPGVVFREGRAAVVEQCVARLAECKARGIDTIVDATAFGHGRDLSIVAEVGARTEVNIVVATGIYTYDALPFYFQFRPSGRSSSDDVMIELFVRDISEGISG